MKIATWNVNSIKVRLPVLLRWLAEASPDVVLLQETKSPDPAFPALELEDAGYNLAVHGQRTYNGVAILSRYPLEDTRCGLPGCEEDPQARYLEAWVDAGDAGLRVASIYLPNGNPVDTEKYPYKLAWMDRLVLHAAALLQREEAVVLGGDYNVIPADVDCHDPAGWAGDALTQPATRRRFRHLLNLGYADAWRLRNQTPHIYSYWDYQGGAWQKDHGVRIDHLLLSPAATDRLAACDIDSGPRAWSRPSDHTPVWCTLRPPRIPLAGPARPPSGAAPRQPG